MENYKKNLEKIEDGKNKVDIMLIKAYNITSVHIDILEDVMLSKVPEGVKFYVERKDRTVEQMDFIIKNRRKTAYDEYVYVLYLRKLEKKYSIKL